MACLFDLDVVKIFCTERSHTLALPEIQPIALTAHHLSSP
jgi:hypothetical protein